MLRDAFARARLELLERPVGSGDAHDRDVEVAAARHGQQGGEDLLVDEVAGRAKENERVGPSGGVSHHQSLDANVLRSTSNVQRGTFPRATCYVLRAVLRATCYVLRAKR